MPNARPIAGDLEPRFLPHPTPTKAGFHVSPPAIARAMARLAWIDGMGYEANVRCLEAMAKVETKPFGAADYLDIAEGNLEFAAILEVMRALDLKITARAG